MNILATPILGLMVVETIPNVDTRGAFVRLYCEQELNTLIGHRKIVQINHSRTVNIGAVRGMHFQHAPHAEMKFVRCLKGRVWDVAVDLRHGSPTFLHWHAEELTPSNGRMMVIPEGFAHGFQALTDNVELLYCHSAPFSPHSEAALDAQDERLAITWPLPILNRSHRDQSPEWLAPDFKGIAP